MANEVLTDATEIITTRPELTPEEWVIVEKAAPYYKALLKPEVRQELEIEFSKSIVALEEKVLAENKLLVEQKWAEWRESQKPLDSSELKKLLSQEYETFEFRLMDSRSGESKTFTIRELPKSIEMKFIDVAKRSIVPALESEALRNFKVSFDADLPEKIMAFISLLPNSFQLLVDLTVICLDPFEKHKLTAEWVSENMSLDRIQAVLLLQINANRYRDFFSRAYQWFLSLRGQRTI